MPFSSAAPLGPWTSGYSTHARGVQEKEGPRERPDLRDFRKRGGEEKSNRSQMTPRPSPSDRARLPAEARRERMNTILIALTSVLALTMFLPVYEGTFP